MGQVCLTAIGSTRACHHGLLGPIFQLLCAKSTQVCLMCSFGVLWCIMPAGVRDKEPLPSRPSLVCCRSLNLVLQTPVMVLHPVDHPNRRKRAVL